MYRFENHKNRATHERHWTMDCLKLIVLRSHIHQQKATTRWNISTPSRFNWLGPLSDPAHSTRQPFSTEHLAQQIFAMRLSTGGRARARSTRKSNGFPMLMKPGTLSSAIRLPIVPGSLVINMHMHCSANRLALNALGTFAVRTCRRACVCYCITWSETCCLIYW